MAWTDVGGAVLLHSAAGPDPQVLERCEDLAARHEPTLVFLDLPPAAGIRDRDAVAACLAERPGELRLVPVGPDRSSAAGLAEWLSHLLGRAVVAPDGDAVEVAEGWFVPATAGAGWTRYEPGRVPVAHSRRLPTPAWESRPFAEPRDLGGGVRVEPLPAGAWITGPGAPQAADSLRKWLTGGLQMDPGHPRVVVGHPGPATVPLAAVQEFWEQLDERTRPVVRFAEFGATASAATGLALTDLASTDPASAELASADPAAGSFGQALADLFATPVVAATGVPVLAPWGSGRSRVRVLLPNGAMHWRPYVWDLRYVPRSAEGTPQDPEPIGYRAPIEGLPEVASGVYEYAPDAVLEVTRSGLWMRPAEQPQDASAVRGAPAEPGRSRVFHAATGSAGVAERMRRLAAEALPRLEAEVRKLAEVLPSTAAITLIRAAASDPAAAAAVAAWETGGELPIEAAPAVEAEAVVGAEMPAEAVVEMEPVASSQIPAEVTAGADLLAEAPSPALVPLVAAPAVAEPVVEIESAPAPPIGRFSLESGPPALDFSLPVAPVQTPAVATAAALSPGHTITPTQPITPAPTPAPAAPPAAPALPPTTPATAPTGARVQPVPSADTTAVPPARSLDLERQWLRRNLAGQYDATAGSVARILSEFPGLRAGGAPDADVLVDLVAVQLYLAGHTCQFDDLVRSAIAGPHVPLARCIASGLRRLPSHRGPVLVRAELTEQDLRWYGSRKVVTEWAFVPCVTGGRLRLPGSTEVLIWSMTARRTHLLAPERPEQVVFLPGTGFKVLSATGRDGARVLLRELSASEVGADGRVDPGRVPLDDVALAGLTEAGERWRQEEASEDLPEPLRGRFGTPPGLIVDSRENHHRPPATAPGGTAS
jgi:hypothetical protein